MLRRSSLARSIWFVVALLLGMREARADVPPASEPPGSGPSTLGPPEREPASPPRWMLGVNGGIAGSPAARPAPLFALFVERSFSPALSFRATPSVIYRSSDPGSVGAATILVAAVDLAGCARLPTLPVLTVGACLGAEGGAASVRAGLIDAAPQYTTVAPWFAGRAVALVDWTVLHALVVEGGVGAIVPLGLRTFELKSPEAERSNFTTYQLAQVGSLLFVGLGVRLR